MAVQLGSPTNEGVKRGLKAQYVPPHQVIHPFGNPQEVQKDGEGIIHQPDVLENHRRQVVYHDGNGNVHPVAVSIFTRGQEDLLRRAEQGQIAQPQPEIGNEGQAPAASCCAKVMQCVRDCFACLRFICCT